MASLATLNCLYYDFGGRQTYNSTNQTINAEIDVNLNYPLIEKSNNYQVAVNKSKVDLSTIPLTNTNIPFKEYEVILRYGGAESSAFVPQVGATNDNFLYTLTDQGIFTVSTYTATGSVSAVSTFTLLNTISVGQFIVDDFGNIYMSTNTTGIGNPFTDLTVYDQTGQEIASYPFTNIQRIAIGGLQKIYVADDLGASSVVNVYNNQNSIGSVSLTLDGTLTTNFAGATLTGIVTVSASNTIMVGYGVNNVTLYNLITLEPITDYVAQNDGQPLPQIDNTSVSTNDSFILSTNAIGTSTYQFMIASSSSMWGASSNLSNYNTIDGLYELDYSVFNPPARSAFTSNPLSSQVPNSAVYAVFPGGMDMWANNTNIPVEGIVIPVGEALVRGCQDDNDNIYILSTDGKIRQYFPQASVGVFLLENTYLLPQTWLPLTTKIFTYGGQWLYAYNGTTLQIYDISTPTTITTQTIAFNTPIYLRNSIYNRVYAFLDNFSTGVWYTADINGQLVQGGSFVTGLTNCFVVGQDANNNVLIYDTGTNPVLQAYNSADILQYTTPLSQQLYSGIYVIGCSYPGPPGYSGVAISYATSNQAFQGSSIFQDLVILDIAKNDATDDIFILTDNQKITCVNAKVLSTTKWTYQSSGGLIGIYSKSGANLSAPNVPIYHFSTLLNAINTAFAEAHAQLKSPPTQIPSVSLNYQTSLATLSGISDYTGTGNGILFNSNLLRILQFESVSDTIDIGFNLLTIPTGTETLTQNDLSLYLFNRLDSIQYVSNTIYVFGSYFANNNTNNVITTVQVPTNTPGYTNNIGQTLYYEPTFLRPYMLASDNSLQRIQLSVYYVYNDGSAYILPIAPKTNWNGTLIFMKRF